MRLLVVEDDARVAGHIAATFEERGYGVDTAPTAAEAASRLRAAPWDAVILDRMLPDGDGLEVLAAWRGAGGATPVLVLSALGEVDDRILGLRAGGDDYLTKPFAAPELVARIEALLRRPPLVGALRLAAGPLAMDLVAREVRRDGRLVDVTAWEFRLLEYLVRNVGSTVTRAMILEHVWDYRFDPQTNIIDQHISRLRQKIDVEGEVSLIQTVRGVGYAFRAS